MQNTEVGWIASGKTKVAREESVRIQSLVTIADGTELTKFWEIEEVQNQEAALSQGDEQCEKWYQETTARNIENTYTVSLPPK